jgi:branched-chain amino acid transport system ATP-binding protein
VPATLLGVENLVKRFGALAVLDGVSLAVEDGRIQGIIGPNGAGKTTLFNVINGIYPADGGRVVYKGRDITGKSLSAIAGLGIGRTFQVARVFSEMTLLENMLVPAIPLGLPTAAARARATELLTLARLDHLAAQPAVEISGGQKKLLEFMRTMMSDPALVLLDEPFNGINPALIELLIDIVQQLNREQGKTFLLISHEMPHVTELCDSVFVLNAGRTIAHGRPAELRENPLVIEAYLGH